MSIRSAICKFIAALTCFLFLFQQISAWALPAREASSYRITKPEILNQEIDPHFVLPKELGLIDERVNNGSNSSVPHIFLIQDYHESPLVQRQISQIIYSILSQFHIRPDNFLVASEGSPKGAIHANRIFWHPNLRLNQQVADYILEKSSMTGTDYLAVTFDVPYDYVGVEDPELYEKNVELFHEMQQWKQTNSLRDAFCLLKEVVQKKENECLNEKLLEFERKKELFDTQGVGLKEFVEYLRSSDHSRQGEKFEQISALIALEELQKKIDPVPFEREKRKTAERQSQLRLQNEFDRKAGELKGEKFFGELAVYAGLLRSKLVRSEKERILLKFKRVITLLKKLVALELTSSEVEELEGILENHKLKEWRTALDTKWSSDEAVRLDDQLELLQPVVDKALAFYQAACKRDEALARNFLHFVKQKKEIRCAFLVSGGFHARGLKDILKKEGYSFSVVSPRGAQQVKENETESKAQFETNLLAIETPLEARWNEFIRSTLNQRSFFTRPHARLIYDAVAASLTRDSKETARFLRDLLNQSPVSLTTSSLPDSFQFKNPKGDTLSIQRANPLSQVTLQKAKTQTEEKHFVVGKSLGEEGGGSKTISFWRNMMELSQRKDVSTARRAWWIAQFLAKQVKVFIEHRASKAMGITFFWGALIVVILFWMDSSPKFRAFFREDYWNRVAQSDLKRAEKFESQGLTDHAKKMRQLAATHFAWEAVYGKGDIPWNELSTNQEFLEQVVPVLIERLKNWNPGVRSHSVNVLVKIGSPAVLPLLALLAEKDLSLDVRLKAEETLVKIGTSAVPVLVGALKDNGVSLDVRLKAEETLVKIGTSAVPALIGVLKNGGRDVRVFAVGALVKIGSPAVRPLMEVLEDKNSSLDVRKEAAEALSRMGMSAVHVLMDMLKDKDSSLDARKEAERVLRMMTDPSQAVPELISIMRGKDLEVLGETKGPQAVPALIGVLKDKDSYWHERQKAMEALVKIGDPAVSALIDVLKDENKDVRWRAALVLGKIGDPQAIPALIEVLKDKDSYPSVRKEAAETLSHIKNPRAVPVLIDALKDKDFSVLKAAAEALVKIGSVPALIGVLKETKLCWSSSRTEAVKALREIKDPQAVPELISALKDEDSSVRCGAVEALGQIKDPQAVPALIDALKDKNSDVRYQAEKSLAQIGSPAVPALVGVLKDKDSSVRCGAVEALGQIKDPQVVPALIDALKDKDEYLRNKAAEALVKIGSSAVPELIEVLKEKSLHSSVRKKAVWALGKIKDPQVVPVLMEALKDKDWDVCEEAAEALGEINDSRAVPALIEVLKDKDSRVRPLVVRVLGNIQDPRVVPALIDALKDEEKNVRWESLKALSEIKDPQVVPALIDALKNSNHDVRWGAVRALGEIKDPQAVPALIGALRDNDWDVRKFAAEVLIKIGSVPALIGVLKDKDSYWEMREKAQEALGAIKDTQAVPALIDALKDEDSSVRWRVVWALGEIGDVRALKPLRDWLDNGGKDSSIKVDIERAIRAIELKEKAKSSGKTAGKSLGKEAEKAKTISFWSGMMGLAQRKDASPARRAWWITQFLTDQFRAFITRKTGKAMLSALFAGCLLGVPVLLMLDSFPRFRTHFREDYWNQMAQSELKRAEEFESKGLTDEAKKMRQLATTHLVWEVIYGKGAIAWDEPNKKQVLNQVEPQLIALLKEKDSDVCFRASIALAKVGSPAVPALIVALRYEDDEDVRLKAMGVLVKIGPPAVPAVIRVLKDKALDSSVRLRVMEALGEINDLQAVPVLIGVLKASDGEMRLQAMKVLVKIGVPAVPTLIDALKDKDKNSSVQWVLVNIGVPAVPALIGALHDEDRNVRQEAVEALGGIKDLQAVPALIDVLKDKDLDVHLRAVEALGEIGDPRAVSTLMDVLKDENSSVRLRAVKALSKIKDPQVVPVLIHMLKDSDRDVRQKTAKVLGDIRDPQAVLALINALKNKDRDVRLRAVEALSKLKDPQVIPALIGALHDEDSNVRHEAVVALGGIKDLRSVPALMNRLKDPVSDVRFCAAAVLGDIRDPQAVPALIDALKYRDWDRDVHRKVVQALGEIGDVRALKPLRDRLDEEGGYYFPIKHDIERAISAVELKEKSSGKTDGKSLGEDGEKAKTISFWSGMMELAQRKGVSPAHRVWLFAQFLAKQVEVFFRHRASKAMGITFVAGAVIVSLVLWMDSSPGFRAFFYHNYWNQVAQSELERAKAFELRGESEAAMRMRELAARHLVWTVFGGKDEKVREEARKLLIEHGGSEAVRVIIGTGEDLKKIDVFYYKLLSQIKDPQAVPALIVALKDKDRPVRLYAVEALGEIRDPQAVPALMDALKDELFSVRLEAAEALVKIGSPAGVPALIGLLHDEDSWVREYAVAALGKIKDPRAVPAIIGMLQDKEFLVRRRVRETLFEIKDPRAVPALIKVLEDNTYDWDVRLKAMEALGEIKDPQAVPALIRVLENNDVGSIVHIEAENALAKIGSPAVSALIHVLSFEYNSGSSRSNAASALGKIKDPQAVPALIDALKNHRMRYEAVVALGEIGDARALPALRKFEGMMHYGIAASRAIAAIEASEKAKSSGKSLGEEGEKVKTISFWSGMMELAQRKGVSPAHRVWLFAQFLAKQVEVFFRHRASKAMGITFVAGGLIVALVLWMDSSPGFRAFFRSDYWNRVAQSELKRAEEFESRGLTDEAKKMRQLAATHFVWEAVYGKGEIPWDELLKNQQFLEQVVSLSIGELKSLDSDVRARSENLLVKIGSPAVPRLIEVVQYGTLRDFGDRTRFGAVRVLGEIKDARAVPILHGVLRSKNLDLDLHMEAMNALAKMGTPAVPALIEVLENENSDMRVRAMKALGDVRDPQSVSALIAVLDKEREGKVAAEELAKIGVPVIPKLISILLDGQKNSTAYNNATIALRKIKNPQVVLELIHALKNTWWDERQHVSVEVVEAVARRMRLVKLLGEIGDARALEPVRECYDDLVALKGHRKVENMKRGDFSTEGQTEMEEGIIKEAIRAIEEREKARSPEKPSGKSLGADEERNGLKEDQKNLVGDQAGTQGSSLGAPAVIETAQVLANGQVAGLTNSAYAAAMKKAMTGLEKFYGRGIFSLTPRIEIVRGAVPAYPSEFSSTSSNRLPVQIPEDVLLKQPEVLDDMLAEACLVSLMRMVQPNPAVREMTRHCWRQMHYKPFQQGSDSDLPKMVEEFLPQLNHHNGNSRSFGAVTSKDMLDGVVATEAAVLSQLDGTGIRGGAESVFGLSRKLAAIHAAVTREPKFKNIIFTLRDMRMLARYVRMNEKRLGVDLALVKGSLYVYGNRLGRVDDQKEKLEEILCKIFISREQLVQAKMTEDITKLIQEFQLKRGPPVNPQEALLIPTLQQVPMVMTESAKKYLEDILQAVVLKDHLLLEGPTGIGKTSLIQYLASQLNVPLRRFNLNAQTDKTEFIGGPRPGEKTGAVHWVNGVLIDAMEKGHWIILDEINLAEPEVLERINSLLDDDGSLVVSEHNDEIYLPAAKYDALVKANPENPDFKNGRYRRIDPRFRIFATMNPSDYAGRKKLSKAFENRLRKVLMPEPSIFELKKILTMRFGFSDTFADQIAQFHKWTVGKDFKADHYTLRHLIRASARIKDRIRSAGGISCPMPIAARDLFEVYGDSLREEGSRKKLENKIKECFKTDLAPLKNYQITEDAQRRVLFDDVALERSPPPVSSHVPGPDAVLTPVPGTLAHLRNLARSVAMREKPLLIGPTGAAKTSLVRYLARLTGHGFRRVNLDGQMDTATLIGQYVPRKEGGGFRWIDGILVEAMRNGEWILLDEINLAEPEILERINSLLDEDGKLMLTEHNGEVIVPHKNFRVFAAMNPDQYAGRKRLSLAMENRFAKKWISSEMPEAEKQLIVKNYLSAKVVGEHQEKLAAAMVAFHNALAQQVKDRRLGAAKIGGYSFTLRDLHSWADFINEWTSQIGLQKALIRGALYVYRDKLLLREESDEGALFRELLAKIPLSVFRSPGKDISLDEILGYKDLSSLAITISDLDYWAKLFRFFCQGLPPKYGPAIEEITKLLNSRREEDKAKALESLEQFPPDLADALIEGMLKDDRGVAMHPAVLAAILKIAQKIWTGPKAEKFYDLMTFVLSEWMQTGNEKVRRGVAALLAGLPLVHAKKILLSIQIDKELDREVRKTILATAGKFLLSDPKNCDPELIAIVEEFLDIEDDEIQKQAVSILKNIEIDPSGISIARPAQLPYWETLRVLWPLHFKEILRFPNSPELLSGVGVLSVIPFFIYYFTSSFGTDVSVDAWYWRAVKMLGGLAISIFAVFLGVFICVLFVNVGKVIHKILSFFLIDYKILNGEYQRLPFGLDLFYRIAQSQPFTTPLWQIHKGVKGVEKAKKEAVLKDLDAVIASGLKSFPPECSSIVPRLASTSAVIPWKTFPLAESNVVKQRIREWTKGIDYQDDTVKEKKGRVRVEKDEAGNVKWVRILDTKVPFRIGADPGSVPHGDAIKLVMTDETIEHLEKIAQAVNLDDPLLLVGPTGTGKTSMITYLAHLTHNGLIRFNLSGQTDKSEFIGGFQPTKDGKFIWQPGVLLRAMEKGHWIILDEMNLAEPEILERLNSLLDDDGHLVVTENEGEVWLRADAYDRLSAAEKTSGKFHRIDPNFRVFATMNPPSESGRKLLSPAFMNRFREKWLPELTEGELCGILMLRFGFSATLAKQVVRFHSEIRKIARRKNFGKYQPDPYHYTIRDLLRLAERLYFDIDEINHSKLVGDKQSPLNAMLKENIYQVYAERLADVSDRELFDTIREISLVDLKADDFDLTVSLPQDISENARDQWVDVAGVRLKKGLTRSAHIPSSEHALLDTEATRKRLNSLAQSVRFHENVLLVGPTGSAKTALVRELARRTFHGFRRLNLDLYADVSDLVGGIVPDPERGKGNYRWQMGVLIEAMEKGEWVLLDEINLASPEILERINSLLDSGTLVLSEHEGETYLPAARYDALPDEVKKSGRYKCIHPDFRVFAAMNPATYGGRHRLSLAMRNRFNEKWLDDLVVPPLEWKLEAKKKDEKEEPYDREKARLASEIAPVLEGWLDGVNGKENIAQKMIQFHQELVDEVESGKTSKNEEYHFSLRDLKVWCRYIQANWKIMDVDQAFQKGAEYVYRDRFYEDSERKDCDEILNHVGWQGVLQALKGKVKKILAPEKESPERLYQDLCRDIAKMSAEDQADIPNLASSKLTETEGMKKVLEKVIQAVRLNDPLLLVGNTGVGKTSVIRYLAALTRTPFRRFNLSGQTDKAEFIGGYYPDDQGKMLWRPGILLDAMEKGHWIVLDEINLAETEVLERINSLLDDEGSIVVSEHDGEVYLSAAKYDVLTDAEKKSGKFHRIDPGFRLFATMNPPEYAGRNVLSPAFSNRFRIKWVEDPDKNDLEQILIEKHHLDPALASDLVRFHLKMCKELGEYSFTIRNLERVVVRIKKEISGMTNRNMIRRIAAREVTEGYGDGVSVDRHLRIFKGIRDEIFGSSEEEAYVFINDDSKNGLLRIGNLELKKKKDASVNAPGPEARLKLVGETTRMLYQLAKCVAFNEKPLLIGPTGSAKTSLIRCLASLTRTGFRRVNLDGEADVSELIGQYIPDPEKPGKYRWKDGVLIEAMRRGEWILLDEINLAAPEILERINSLLDDDGFIVLTEKGGKVIEKVKPHPNFRLFAAMNPHTYEGRNRLSPAMMNKFVQKWVPGNFSIPELETIAFDYAVAASLGEEKKGWFDRARERWRARTAENQRAKLEKLLRAASDKEDLKIGTAEWWMMNLETRELFIPEKFLSEKPYTESAAAALHEEGHVDITYADPYFVEKGYRAALHNAVEDPRVNESRIAKWPGARAWFRQLYADLYPKDPKDSKMEKKLNMKDVMPHLQFTFGLIHHWANGKEHPEITDPQVLGALSATRQAANDVFSVIPGTVTVCQREGELCVISAYGRKMIDMPKVGSGSVAVPDTNVRLQRSSEKKLKVTWGRKEVHEIVLPKEGERIRVVLNNRPNDTEKQTSSRTASDIMKREIMPHYMKLVKESMDQLKQQEQGKKGQKQGQQGQGQGQSQSGKQQQGGQSSPHQGQQSDGQGKPQSGAGPSMEDIEKEINQLPDDDPIKRDIEEKSKRFADELEGKITRPDKNRAEQNVKDEKRRKEIEKKKEAAKKDQAAAKGDEKKDGKEAKEADDGKEGKDGKSGHPSDRKAPKTPEEIAKETDKLREEVDKKSRAVQEKAKAAGKGDAKGSSGQGGPVEGGGTENLEEITQLNKTPYEKYFGPIGPYVYDLATFLENIFEKTTRPRYKGFYRTGRKPSLKREMQYQASNYNPAYEKRWLRKTKPKKFKIAVTMILDESGSMSSDRESVTQSLILMMEAFDKLKIPFSVIGFHSTYRTHFPYHRAFTEENKEDFIRDLNYSFDKSGGTNDKEPIDEGIRQIGEEEAEVKLIVVITDGVGCGREGLKPFFQKAFEKRIAILGIGVGGARGAVSDVYANTPETPNISGLTVSDVKNLPFALRDGLLETVIPFFFGGTGIIPQSETGERRSESAEPAEGGETLVHLRSILGSDYDRFVTRAGRLPQDRSDIQEMAIQEVWNTDSLMREIAVRILAEIGDEKAVRDLRDVLRDEEDSNMVRAIGSALAYLRTPDDESQEAGGSSLGRAEKLPEFIRAHFRNQIATGTGPGLVVLPYRDEFMRDVEAGRIEPLLGPGNVGIVFVTSDEKAYEAFRKKYGERFAEKNIALVFYRKSLDSLTGPDVGNVLSRPEVRQLVQRLNGENGPMEISELKRVVFANPRFKAEAGSEVQRLIFEENKIGDQKYRGAFLTTAFCMAHKGDTYLLEDLVMPVSRGVYAFIGRYVQELADLNRQSAVIARAA